MRNLFIKNIALMRESLQLFSVQYTIIFLQQTSLVKWEKLYLNYFTVTDIVN